MALFKSNLFLSNSLATSVGFLQRNQLMKFGFTALLISSVLAGCAQNPYVPNTATAKPSAAQLALNQALASQDPKQIATAQMNLATQAQGQTKAELQMRAVETAIDAEDFTLANNLYAQTNTQNSWPRISPRRAQLLTGFGQWQQGQPQNALTTITNLPIPLTPEEAQRRLVLLAAIDEALGQTIDAARQRSALNELLSDGAADANRAKLWNDLTTPGLNQLGDAAKQASDQTFADWLGLALLYRARPGELNTWIKNHPNHPAVTSGFTALLLSKSNTAANIPTVAGNGPIIVLLPLTGEYQPISKAISDGINFAHDRLGFASERSVQIQDSGSTLSSFTQALAGALASNPSLIIGPLLKEQISALNNMPGNAPPVIALNTPPDGAALPAGVISYSLSPDADARAAADQMIHDQKMTALVYCPDNGMGHRICDAFSREYSLLGGTVVDSAYFDPTATDFSHQMRRLLQVHSASSGSFQPRIRDDVQGIFVGATSQQARMIVPQLDYFGADQLPRYGIGMVYSGTPNTLADQDKNGLVIPVEPVLLAANDGPNDPMLANYERASLSQLPRLFAFGADALTVAANLNGLLAHHTLNGLTGQLSLSLTGEIERKPAWAQFRQGLLQPMSGTDSGLLPSTVLDSAPTSPPAASPPPGLMNHAEATDSFAQGNPANDTRSPAPVVPAPTPTFTDGGGLAPTPVAQ
ncbi:MAG: penicillin-binding protein activator [Halothiobacillus sp.]